MNDLNNISAAEARFDEFDAPIIDGPRDRLAHLLHECDRHQAMVDTVARRSIRRGRQTETEAADWKARQIQEIDEIRGLIRGPVSEMRPEWLMTLRFSGIDFSCASQFRRDVGL